MVGRVAACTTSAGGAPSLRFPPRLPPPIAPKAGALGAPVRSGLRQNRAGLPSKRERMGVVVGLGSQNPRPVAENAKRTGHRTRMGMSIQTLHHRPHKHRDAHTCLVYTSNKNRA